MSVESKVSISDKPMTDKVIAKMFVFEGHFDQEFIENKVTEVTELVVGYPSGTVCLFDCVNLSYISSQGIAALANWHQILQEKGGKLIFIGVRGNVFDVLNVVGLAQIFTFCSSLDEAKLEIEKLG